MLSHRISQLTPPPRPIPLHVVCSALLGIIGGLGAIFLIVGAVAVIAFGGGFHPVAELRMALSTATAQGVVTNVTATNASVNDVTVYRYEFTFNTPDEQGITGQSYTTGWTRSEGDRVRVEYVPGNPTIARIEEMRLAQFSPWVFALTLIFPAVGAALFGAATAGGLRQVTLLRHGEIAGRRSHG